MTGALGALVLASGEGRRMLPLTQSTPKPLLPVLGRSIISRTLGAVRELDPTRMVVGLHYRAEHLARHVRAVSPDAECREERQLSGPAGAVRLFGAVGEHDTLLVVSGDVVFDADLQGLVDAHRSSGAALTFGTRRVTRARRFGVLRTDASGAVVEAVEKPDVPDEEEHLVSAGIYCLSARGRRAIPSGRTFDFAAHLAPELLERGELVGTHALPGYWSDVGTPTALRRTNLDALAGELAVDPGPGVVTEYDGGIAFVSAGARVDEGAEIIGLNVVSDHAAIPGAAQVANSVLLGSARLAPGAVLHDALLWAPDEEADRR